jgi:hypothetical protein
LPAAPRLVVELKVGHRNLRQFRKSRPPCRRLDPLKASPQARLPAPQCGKAATSGGGAPRSWRARPRAAGGLPIRRRLTTCPTTANRRGLRRFEDVVVQSTLFHELSRAEGPSQQGQARKSKRLDCDILARALKAACCWIPN